MPAQQKEKRARELVGWWRGNGQTLAARNTGRTTYCTPDCVSSIGLIPRF